MQILFHRSGVDPDFNRRSRFDLDFNFMIESIVKRFKDSEESVLNIELNQKLEEAITLKVEAEAKLQQEKKFAEELQAKLQKLMDSKNQIMDQVESPSSVIPPPPPPPPPPPLPSGKWIVLFELF